MAVEARLAPVVEGVVLKGAALRVPVEALLAVALPEENEAAANGGPVGPNDLEVLGQDVRLLREVADTLHPQRVGLRQLAVQREVQALADAVKGGAGDSHAGLE